MRRLLPLFVLALAGCSGPVSTPVAPGAEQRFPEHYAASIAALGHPGARRAFQVGPGSVISTGEAALEWRIESPGSTVETTPVWFERDGVPIAHWEMSAPGLRVRFEAAAAPLSGLGDTSLVASVRATAECVGDAPVEVVLVTRVRSLPEGPHFVPWDAPERWSSDEAWQGNEALRGERSVARFDPAATLPPDAPTRAHPARIEGPGPGALSARCVARLTPGQSDSWEFRVPLYPVLPGERTLERDATHDRVAAESRRFWRTTFARAASLETPDTLVNAAWRAALVTLVQCQERDAGHWVPIGNPFQYRDVWLRDGARALRALAVLGLPDYAREGAIALAGFQFPSGVLLSQRGQLDGVGQGLWAWAQVCALGQDTTLARELLPHAVQAGSWIARQRVNTRTLGLPWSGLLPFGDPRDGELVRAQLVGNDAWAIAGLDGIATLAAISGDAATVLRAAAEARDYRVTFAAALSRVKHPDLPPSWQDMGRDWGNTSVAYPTCALAFDDPRLEKLARRMLAHGGSSGLTCYGPDDSLHTYNGADLAQWAIQTGRPGIARAWLNGILAHSSSTLGQAEILSARTGDFGLNLPPHTTAAACLVDLMRNMMISDLSDTLEIALGADTTWWQGTRLARAATRFGATSLHLDRPAAGVLRVRLDPVDTPVCVVVPPGLRAIRALTPGARVRNDHRVDVPARTTEIRIHVVPERGR